MRRLASDRRSAISGVPRFGKVKMGALKWGLKATLCNLRTIVYNRAHLWHLWTPF